MFPVNSLLNSKKIVSREKAVVIDVRDPDKKGRIIVDCHTLGTTSWIPYIMAPSQFFPPKYGDIVYIECEEGFEWAPVAHGRLYNPGQVTESLGAIHPFFREVPTASGFVSNGPLTTKGTAEQAIQANGTTGHALIFDDGEATYGSDSTDSGKSIKLLSMGNNKIIICDDSSKFDGILIADATNDSDINVFDTNSGNFIFIDSANNTITIQDVNGNRILLNSSEISIQAQSKKINIIAAQNIEITSSAQVIVNASGNITLNSTSNSFNGGVVTSNTINNDPITGIPLTPVGGIITGS